MKRIALPLTLVVLFLTAHTLLAQKEILISSKKIAMSKGEQPAFIVEIPEADYESSLKNWEKLIRQNTKNKITEADHEMIMMGTTIIEIYNEPINIYSAIIQGDSSLKLIAVFEIDSVFFDYEKSDKTVKEEKTNSQIKHFLNNYATQQYLYAIENELEMEEGKLKDLNKELENLAKENENYLKDISENEQNIKNSQDALSSYEMDNERKQGEINSKKEAISGIANDPELLDQAKSQLKGLEKEKKGIQNKLEKEQKNVIKYQADIESLNIDVERNMELQTAKKAEIDQQELVLETVKKKLHNIN